MVPTLPDPILSTTDSIQSPQESNCSPMLPRNGWQPELNPPTHSHILGNPWMCLTRVCHRFLWTYERGVVKKKCWDLNRWLAPVMPPGLHLFFQIAAASVTPTILSQVSCVPTAWMWSFYFTINIEPAARFHCTVVQSTAHHSRPNSDARLRRADPHCVAFHART